MSSTRWRVSFELVSPMSHPECYRGDHPAPGVIAAELDDSYWQSAERETPDEDGARDQVKGLNGLVERGELIRNVRLERADAPIWEAVDGS
jgi:hypothetical protein